MYCKFQKPDKSPTRPRNGDSRTIAAANLTMVD